jgi:hypothetical protein
MILVNILFTVLLVRLKLRKTVTNRPAKPTSAVISAASSARE